VTGVGGLNQLLTVNYSNNTNAGTATVSASFAGDANHTGSADSKSFTIDKASSGTAVSCPTNVTYTGSPLGPCSATVTGAGGLNQSLTVIYTDNTNAGTATASASFAGDANHTGSSDSKAFTIDKASSITTVSCPASVVYNDSAQTPCTAAASGVGGLNQSLTVIHSNNINAGTAMASATFAGDANHTGSSHSSYFTVTKAPATIMLSSLGSFIYNGTPRAATATTTPAGLTVVTVTYSGYTTAPTNVGTYAVVASLNNPNYEAPNATGTIAITPWTLNGFYQPVDMGGVLNTVKGGSTVPLKFEVFQGTTELTDVTVVKSTLTYLVTCETNAVQEEIETIATGGTVLRYDATAGQFIYNWQTPKSPGKCYNTVVTTQDGSSLQAKFKLK
jgi:MBG domain